MRLSICEKFETVSSIISMFENTSWPNYDSNMPTCILANLVDSKRYHQVLSTISEFIKVLYTYDALNKKLYIHRRMYNIAGNNELLNFQPPFNCKTRGNMVIYIDANGIATTMVCYSENKLQNIIVSENYDEKSDIAQIMQDTLEKSKLIRRIRNLYFIMNEYDTKLRLSSDCDVEIITHNSIQFYTNIHNQHEDNSGVVLSEWFSKI